MQALPEGFLFETESSKARKEKDAALAAERALEAERHFDDEALLQQYWENAEADVGEQVVLAGAQLPVGAQLLQQVAGETLV